MGIVVSNDKDIEILPGSCIVMQTSKYEAGFTVESTEVRLRASYQKSYITLQLTIWVFCWSVELH